MEHRDIQKMMGLMDNAKVLVVGDVGLDSYIVGDVKKISPEAPVPVVEAHDSYHRLGLSANVANNVKALGAQCRLIGVIGNDQNASIIKDELKNIDVASDGLIVDAKRPTTLKTRVLASRLHHVVRIDHEDISPLSDDIKTAVMEQANAMIPWCDIVILEDYAKGLFANGISRQIIDLCRKNKKPVFVDPSRYTDP